MEHLTKGRGIGGGLAVAALAAAVAGAAASGDDAGAGAKVFAGKCATCHAKDAKGNPKMAKMYKVEVAALDLTGKAAQGKTDAELAAIVKDGKGKNMKGFAGKLTDAEIAAVVAHLRTLKGGGAPAAAADAGAGAKLFSAKCTMCHGKDAKGNEKMAKMYKVEPAALDLTGEAAQSRTDAQLTDTVKNGKGKNMKGFAGKLSDGEIASVVAYLRTLAKH